MSWPITLICIGTLAIAAGGVLATYGWNAHTEQLQRNGIIQAIAAESFVNLNIIRGKSYSEEEPTALKNQTVYPRLRTSALGAAITSGLLFAEKDRLLLTRISDLLDIVRDFNSRLNMLEEPMLRMKGEELASYRAKIRDSGIRKSINEKLVRLMRLLISEYGIEEEQEFFVELEENAA